MPRIVVPPSVHVAQRQKITRVDFAARLHLPRAFEQGNRRHRLAHPEQRQPPHLGGLLVLRVRGERCRKRRIRVRETVQRIKRQPPHAVHARRHALLAQFVQSLLRVARIDQPSRRGEIGRLCRLGLRRRGGHRTLSAGPSRPAPQRRYRKPVPNALHKTSVSLAESGLGVRANTMLTTAASPSVAGSLRPAETPPSADPARPGQPQHPYLRAL